MNQAQLAERVGIVQNQVSRYERGHNEPPADLVARLARALNTSADYLLGLSNIAHPGAEPDPHPDLTPTQIEMLTLMETQSKQAQQKLLEAVRLLLAMHEN